MNRLPIIFLALALLACANADAQNPAQPGREAPPVPAAPQLSARSYLLVDFDSGRSLVELEPDLRVEPASITKMMSS